MLIISCLWFKGSLSDCQGVSNYDRNGLSSREDKANRREKASHDIKTDTDTSLSFADVSAGWDTIKTDTDFLNSTSGSLSFALTNSLALKEEADYDWTVRYRFILGIYGSVPLRYYRERGNENDNDIDRDDNLCIRYEIYIAALVAHNMQHTHCLPFYSFLYPFLLKINNNLFLHDDGGP